MNTNALVKGQQELVQGPLWCPRPAVWELLSPQQKASKSIQQSLLVSNQQIIISHFYQFTINLQCLWCGCYGNNSLPGKAMQHIHRFIRSLITQLPSQGLLGKPVTQKRMPPVLPFAKSFHHFAALHSAEEETRCHFSSQSLSSVIDV